MNDDFDRLRDALDDVRRAVWNERWALFLQLGAVWVLILLAAVWTWLT